MIYLYFVRKELENNRTFNFNNNYLVRVFHYQDCDTFFLMYMVVLRIIVQDYMGTLSVYVGLNQNAAGQWYWAGSNGQTSSASGPPWAPSEPKTGSSKLFSFPNFNFFSRAF